MDGVRTALRVNIDFDGHRSAPDPNHLSHEANHIADQYRFFELHAVEGHGDEGDTGITAAQMQFALGGNSAGQVDVREKHAAEDRAVLVGVPWHHRHLNGDIRFAGERRGVHADCFRKFSTRADHLLSLAGEQLRQIGDAQSRDGHHLRPLDQEWLLGFVEGV